ncbi:hypothetical protein WDU94_010695 [Cyamophila willieti]
MQRAILIVLLAGFVLGASIKSKNNNLPPKINSMNAVLKIYNKESETIVSSFKAIQSSIAGLDLMSINYNGICTSLIDQASNSGHQAIDKYNKGRNFLVRWCAFAKDVFDSVLSKDNKLTEDKVKKLVGKTIDDGFQAFNESLTTLNTVVNDLRNIQKDLELIPEKMKLELKQLQANHQYIKMQQEEDRARANKRVTQRQFCTCNIFNQVVTFVSELIFTPDGEKMCLIQQLISNGIVLERVNNDPDTNQQMKIVEVYYTTLINTTESAMANVTKFADEFEHSFVNKLQSWVENENTIDVNINGNQDSECLKSGKTDTNF